ncbi:MAG: hypothetical protein M1269_08735 [Chloroflexi bacterium]|nr:hypothetical protein [Chloroflexota bacterium]
MKNTLGVDIGNGGVHSVVMPSAVQFVPEREIPRDYNVVVAVPARLLTFRQLTLPFSDSRRLTGIIKEEISDSLLFPVEDAVWDYISSRDGRILAVIANRADMEDFKSRVPVEYRHMDAEPLALGRVAAASGIKDALLIDMGAQNTLFVGMKDGMPEFFRLIPRGGNNLTSEIEAADSLSPVLAEARKKEAGTEHPVVRRFINDLFVSALISTPFPHEKIVLSGGGAALPGLCDFISEKLGVETVMMPMPEGLSPCRDAVAYGAALYGKHREDSVELGGVVKKEDQPWKVWLALILLPVILLSVSLQMKIVTLEGRNKQFSQKIEVQVKQVMPEALTGSAGMAQMKKEVEEAVNDYNDPGRRVLPLLSDIGNASSPGITVNEMDFTGESFTLKGEAESFEQVDEFRKKLGASFKKADLEEGKTTPEKKISFSLRLEP